ncbi:hypothetical protein CRENPOLYSF1_670036 [Crenothrix polyspora]|uniref:Uncharacterized protein n=1 Tax=Crenothrix polyspora TaxID=360316 RepID=A0A1R4HH18_9GAMM|nr:hypothetical protein CRENPOLYSF1_670036 [Crenothrix polyspora]
MSITPNNDTRKSANQQQKAVVKLMQDIFMKNKRTSAQLMQG